MNENFLFQGNTLDQYKDTIEAQLEQPATQKKHRNTQQRPKESDKACLSI